MQARVLLALAGWLVLATGAAQAASWIELGDAGTTASPQSTEGAGNLTEIHGVIGVPCSGDPDSVDAFLFRYGGADPPDVLAPSAGLGLRVFDGRDLPDLAALAERLAAASRESERPGR